MNISDQPLRKVDEIRFQRCAESRSCHHLFDEAQQLADEQQTCNGENRADDVVLFYGQCRPLSLCSIRGDSRIFFRRSGNRSRFALLIGQRQAVAKGTQQRGEIPQVSGNIGLYHVGNQK